MKIISMQFLATLTALTVSILPASISTAAEHKIEPLTLARVIELSSADAPEVRLASSRIAEGEAKLAGAQVRSLENPSLDLSAGPRTGSETTIDLELGAEIPIELGNRRDKRSAVARAGLEQARHATEDARRLSVAAAVGAYYRVLQAEERLGLAGERKAVADQVLRIAQDRHAAGDAARFEVNLGRTEMARAESEIAAARGRLATARASFARTLGLPSAAGLQIAGNLKERNFFDAIQSAQGLPKRADLSAAQAEVEASQAAISLAEAERLPDLALRLSYKREGDENVALGGVSFTLPFLNPRQAQVQEARVQHQRAQLAAQLSQAAISAEIEGARKAYAAAVEAVGRLESDGVALQQENETLAQESYRAGKINLSTLLQLRKDALETRQEYLDRLLEAAEAGVELASACGKWTTTN